MSATAEGTVKAAPIIRSNKLPLNSESTTSLTDTLHCPKDDEHDRIDANSTGDTHNSHNGAPSDEDRLGVEDI